jgi:ABC-type multidrug transport system ATPase subunit
LEENNLNDYILTAEHIKKEYNGNTVLRDVSIYIKKGEIYGLIGKNGSGKTTLFRILTGLIQRYNGTVSVGKVNTHKSKVSAVINSPSLFLNLSAFENMKAQAFLLGIHNDSRIKQTLKTVGLQDYKNILAKNFSLGMTQRLKLGMALLKTPDILILDEPINGLDPDGIVELRELLLNLNHTDGMTILTSSQIL